MKPKKEKEKPGPKEFSFQLEHLEKLPVYCYSEQEGAWVQDYWFDSECHELVGIPPDLDLAPPSVLDVANLALKIKQLKNRADDDRFGYEINKAAELLGEVAKSYAEYRQTWLEVNQCKLDTFVCVEMLMHKIRTKDGKISKSPKGADYFLKKVARVTRSLKDKSAAADFWHYASGRAVAPFPCNYVPLVYRDNKCEKLVGVSGFIRRHIVVDFCRDLKLAQQKSKQKRPR